MKKKKKEEEEKRRRRRRKKEHNNHRDDTKWEINTSPHPVWQHGCYVTKSKL